MGLFKHKEKRPDLETTLGPAKNLPSNPNPPPGQNSFNDSTYYSGSDVSHPDPLKATQNQQKAQGKPPGTTVTTTTTTTTTTTVVTEDGGMQTESHPYDPATDPPQQQSQTTYPTVTPSPAIAHNDPSNAPSTTKPSTVEATTVAVEQPPSQKPQYHRTQTPPRKPTPQALATFGQHELPAPGPLHPEVVGAPTRESPLPPIPGRSNSTSGGRAIPPRSELRNSRQPDAVPVPTADARHAQYPQVEPLSTNRPYSQNLQPGGDALLVSPTSPIIPAPRSKTPNFSRPDAAAHVSKRENVMSAVKGIHGAGEALRGTVNGTIARGVGDSAELERSRGVRDQGVNEFRSSGIREGFREKAEGRMRTRRRSGSANPGEGQGHVLDRVDEVR